MIVKFISVINILTGTSIASPFTNLIYQIGIAWICYQSFDGSITFLSILTSFTCIVIVPYFTYVYAIYIILFYLYGPTFLKKLGFRLTINEES